MYRFLIIIVIAFARINYILAQELEVKSFVLLADDQSAEETPHFDLNGNTCALLKIKTNNIEDLVFPKKDEYIISSGSMGTYYVYISPILRKLTYQHSSFLPGQIDAAEYGYKRLIAGKTYLIELEAPITNNGRNAVILKVIPEETTISINGEDISQSEGGIYNFSFSPGTYNYNLEAENYFPIKGSFVVTENESQTITLQLKPIVQRVKIECNVNNAHVFIDNIDHGKVGSIDIPQGLHNIRIQSNGYYDSEENVKIDENTQYLSFQLVKNKNTKEIHAVPVTIFSSSHSIYKNNKKIKGWVSGEPVLIMPGSYEITNNLGNAQTIIVGSEPIEIHLDDTPEATENDDVNYLKTQSYTSPKNNYNNINRRTQYPYANSQTLLKRSNTKGRINTMPNNRTTSKTNRQK